jgi:hypothetical protein
MFQSIIKYYKQNDQQIFVMLGQLAVFLIAIAFLIYSVLQISTWNGFQFDPFLTIALVYIVYQQNKVLKSIQLQNQQNMQILAKLVDVKLPKVSVNVESTKAAKKLKAK